MDDKNLSQTRETAGRAFLVVVYTLAFFGAILLVAFNQLRIEELGVMILFFGGSVAVCLLATRLHFIAMGLLWLEIAALDMALGFVMGFFSFGFEVTIFIVALATCLAIYETTKPLA